VAEQQLRVECHCGWNTTGTEDFVVEETQDHVMKVHWTEAEREDVLELAVPVDG
jgi:predicted small metal-binding protein